MHFLPKDHVSTDNRSNSKYALDEVKKVLVSSRNGMYENHKTIGNSNTD